MTQHFDNVQAMGWSGDPDMVTYGTLQEMGHLLKEYEPAYFPGDGPNIRWTVVGDITFTDNYGHTFKQGDSILWEK